MCHVLQRRAVIDRFICPVVVRLMRTVSSGDGNGIRRKSRAENQDRRQRRVILSRAYPSGIDPEPKITVAGIFPPE